MNHLRQENDLEVLQLRGFMQILLRSYCFKGRFLTEQACFLPPRAKACSTDILFQDIVQYSRNLLIQAC